MLKKNQAAHIHPMCPNAVRPIKEWHSSFFHSQIISLWDKT